MGILECCVHGAWFERSSITGLDENFRAVDPIRVSLEAHTRGSIFALWVP